MTRPHLPGMWLELFLPLEAACSSWGRKGSLPSLKGGAGGWVTARFLPQSIAQALARVRAYSLTSTTAQTTTTRQADDC